MITKNGLVAFPHFLTGELVQSGTLYDIDNTVYSYSMTDGVLNNLRTTNNMTGNAGMVMNLGVGTTPATTDDVWLDNVMVNGVDVNTIVKCISCLDKPAKTIGGELLFTYSFRNDGSSNISVSELALSYYENSSNKKIMFARKVIPTRVIQPNEVVTFSYVLKFV